MPTRLSRHAHGEHRIHCSSGLSDVPDRASRNTGRRAAARAAHDGASRTSSRQRADGDQRQQRLVTRSARRRDTRPARRGRARAVDDAATHEGPQRHGGERSASRQISHNTSSHHQRSRACRRGSTVSVQRTMSDSGGRPERQRTCQQHQPRSARAPARHAASVDAGERQRQFRSAAVAHLNRRFRTSP